MASTLATALRNIGRGPLENWVRTQARRLASSKNSRPCRSEASAISRIWRNSSAAFSREIEHVRDGAVVEHLLQRAHQQHPGPAPHRSRSSSSCGSRCTARTLAVAQGVPHELRRRSPEGASHHQPADRPGRHLQRLASDHAASAEAGSPFDLPSGARAERLVALSALRMSPSTSAGPTRFAIRLAEGSLWGMIGLTR